MSDDLLSSLISLNHLAGIILGACIGWIIPDIIRDFKNED